MSEKDLSAELAAVANDTTEASDAASHAASFQCAMCEGPFRDDDVIRLVESRLVCEDCYEDLPSAEAASHAEPTPEQAEAEARVHDRVQAAIREGAPWNTAALDKHLPVSNAAPDGWSIEFSYGSYRQVENRVLQRVPYESTYEGSHSEASARERYQKAVAAPELYEALKLLDERGHTTATWEFAKRALAKAEGK